VAGYGINDLVHKAVSLPEYGSGVAFGVGGGIITDVPANPVVFNSMFGV
jgi:hypothetical protein